MFDRPDGEVKGLSQIQQGAKSFEQGLEREEQKLQELFASLKTQLLDKMLSGEEELTDDHLRILQKQVRHVISIARILHFKELIASFSKEQDIIHQLEDLLRKYPDIHVSDNPDLQSMLTRLRDMIKSQQQLIFSHQGILTEEKVALIDILEQAQQLQIAYDSDHHMKPPTVETTY